MCGGTRVVVVKEEEEEEGRETRVLGFLQANASLCEGVKTSVCGLSEQSIHFK